MLLIRNGCRRKYAYDGKGLFDIITGLVGRVFTPSAAKSLGNKNMSAASNAALKGVEKWAKAVDHVIDNRLTERRMPTRRINV